MADTLAVLAEALYRGSRTIWEPPDRPRLVEVPPDLRARLLADRDTLRRVLARAAAFRSHLGTSGVVPVLVLPDRPPGDSGCLSCGVATAGLRCAECSLACWIALGRTPPPNILSRP